MRIIVAGNSVALYVRPRTASGRPYAHRLRELVAKARAEPVDVQVFAVNSMTAADLVRDYEDRLIASRADVTVLHVGIVECTPRILPQRWRQAFIRGQTPAQRLWVLAEARVRRPVVRLLGGVTAMNADAFGAALARAVGAAGDGGGQVICLGIATPTARVEAEVPGVTAEVRRFDGVIRNVCARTGAAYLDVESIAAALGRERAIPDGIHFSEDGHDAVAAELVRIIGTATRAERPLPSEPAPSKGPATSSGALRWGAYAVAAPLVAFASVWIPAVRLTRSLRRSRR